MKRITLMLFMSIISIGLTGCMSTTTNTIGGNTVDMEKSIDNLQELMDKDVTGDKQSVFWDGEKAEVKTDAYDDNNIQDGRYSTGGEYLKKELWSINIGGLEDIEKVTDTETHILYKGKDWQLEVKMVDDFDVTVEELKADDKLKLVKEELGEATFRGVQAVDDKYYAGYVFVRDDFFGHIYQISYVGIGNIQDIGIMASQINDQFTVNFTLDNLKEKEEKVLSN